MKKILPFLFLLMLGGKVTLSQPEMPVGVGFVKPVPEAGQTLYFYSEPEAETLPGSMAPVDSVVFKAEGQHYIDVASAPPWLMPEVLKLDYDLFFLRAVTLRHDFIEVVINRETGETRWIDRLAVDFLDWPTFLLNVFAVEVNDPEANPIRSSPDAAAPILSTAPVPLKPLAVQGSWMQVSASEVADRIVPTGWIRWREPAPAGAGGDRLLITYSLLS